MLALDENHWRVAGPFAGQALYLVCGYDEGQPCRLRDEAGAACRQAPLDDLLALRDDRWLGRSLNAWFVLDAQGRRVDAQALALTASTCRSAAPLPPSPRNGRAG